MSKETAPIQSFAIMGGISTILKKLGLFMAIDNEKYPGQELGESSVPWRPTPLPSYDGRAGGWQQRPSRQPHASNQPQDFASQCTVGK